MPSGFGDLADHAHHLVSTGDLAGARRLLADALTDVDPRPANATPELAEAASLQARVLVALGDPQAARGWAAYAYAATTRLHGRSDERTVAAAAALAAVLHRVGSWSRAARLYQMVILELTALDGPESRRVLAAHADLATVEYARGQCQVARDRLADAWELHREVYGDGYPSGIKMLARLGAMRRDCGRFAEAHDDLALAEELCHRHLPPDDPLTGQVTALTRAAASPDHTCTDTMPVGRETPIVPTARTPPPGDEPQHSPYHPSQPGYRPAGPYAPAEPGLDGPDVVEHPAAGYAPPPSVPTPRQPLDGAAGGTPVAGEAWDTGPDITDETWRPEQEPGGDTWRPEQDSGGYRPPGGDAADHSWTGTDTNDGWPPATSHGWPPATSHGWAGEPDTDELWRPGTPAAERATAVPPSVLPLTGAEEAAGVHRVAHHAVPDDPPYQPSRLLPVPVHRPAPPPANRLLPLVVGGVAVVLLGTAAVIAGVSRFDGAPPAVTNSSGHATGTPAPTTGRSTPATTVAASPGTPPGALILRDGSDNVTLRWTYPAGGEGPVVISGGRAGQQQTAFANLPAGTTDFVVYGLNRSTDYCFTVAVVWSTDTIARSKQVCTDRG
ncbi:tetratricopeptide repeat protein [Micromonospora sp. WMMA1363]|uniref:tetratricopeptide repeat protein n=1 Tax=Micromonospora sp. WMMA1363 TaxID=3053985 RepID=UPI00259CD243|nr:tetratricopeptide repeat protein [Micromonospora sp. WMMA1363]MDM4718228.1 tetratricopeptide repeat protein [Micromonospora sp. WMMA1363]